MTSDGFAEPFENIGIRAVVYRCIDDGGILFQHICCYIVALPSEKRASFPYKYAHRDDRQ